MPWTRLAGWFVLLAACASVALAQSPTPPSVRASAGSGESRMVLVLIPVQQGRPMFDLLARGVTNEFLRASGLRVSVSFEHLHDLLDPPGLSARQLEFLRAKYAGQRIDAVIGLGHARYAQAREELGVSPSVPLILLGAPRQARPANSVNLALTGSVPDSYAWVRPLLPPSHRVALVGGGSAMDRRANASILRSLRESAGPSRVADLTGVDLATLRERVAQQPAGTAFVLGSVLAEPDGRLVTFPMLLSAIGPLARGPIIVVNDVLLGEGVLGGALYRVEELGARAAALALRVLQGTPADTIGEVSLVPTPAVDARQMKRFGLPLDRVPAGTQVLWQEPSLWESYGTWIIAGTTVFTVQAALIVGLWVERRRRHESQRHLAERLRIQALVAEVSSGFANLEDNRLDAQIVTSLERTGLAVGAVACALFVIDRGATPPRAVSRWQRTPASAAGARPAPHADDDLIAWAWPRLERGEELLIGPGDPLPMELAPHDADVRRAAIVLLPLRVDQRVIAVIAFWHDDAPAADAPAIADLRTIGEIIATAVIRKRTDIAMREQLETLAHVNRVASLGDLAASLAHELNQPLGAILSNAEVAQALLQQPEPPLPMLREILADVIADDERAGGIIRNMRNMLRRHELESGVTDVNLVTTELRRLVTHDARLRGTALHVDLGDELPLVTIASTQLQQVLLNLVVNAVDAMAGAQARQAVELRTRALHDGVELEVRDHGPGIPEAALPRLFDPFFTTKPHGLGVGLSITRSIVEAAGGRIEAGNAHDGGAVFRVWLPRAASTSATGDPQALSVRH